MKQVGTLTLTLPSDREIEVTRMFNAPRALVFRAMTEPPLVQRWLTGMPGWTMPVCEIDLRVGGAYRYLWRNADGMEMGMGGVFQEISRPERLVATEKFDEAWYPGEALDTSVLVERDGKTTLTLTVQYDSRETRDAVVETGAIDGMSGSYDGLEALLAQLGRETQ